MLKLKKNTACAIAALIKEKYPTAVLSCEEVFDMLEYPPDKAMGDLALPCFRLSKSLRRSPMEIAKTLSESLTLPEFSSVEVQGGYLNFRVNGSAFAKRVIGEIEEK